MFVFIVFLLFVVCLFVFVCVSNDVLLDVITRCALLRVVCNQCDASRCARGDIYLTTAPRLCCSLLWFLIRYSNPDKKLFAKANDAIDGFKNAFQFVRAPPKADSVRTFWSDALADDIQLDSYLPNSKKQKNDEAGESLTVAVGVLQMRISLCGASFHTPPRDVPRPLSPASLTLSILVCSRGGAC
jgi:hypothetical protein